MCAAECAEVSATMISCSVLFYVGLRGNKASGDCLFSLLRLVSRSSGPTFGRHSVHTAR